MGAKLSLIVKNNHNLTLFQHFLKQFINTPSPNVSYAVTTASPYVRRGIAMLIPMFSKEDMDLPPLHVK